MYLALLLSIQMVMAEPNTEPMMTPTQIYGLMDNGDWKNAVLQAQRLVDAQPSNAVALLTLGDALAQYPSGGGDVFAAFDVWNQAKSTATNGSRTQRFAQERLGWTLQHSALLKMVPMSSTGMRWWDKSFSYKMYIQRDINLESRTDYLKGAIYTSNLPSEEIILEVQPGKGLPTLIQSYTPQKGTKQTIYIPADMASVRVALEQGQFVTKDTGGRAILDRYVQQQIDDDAAMQVFAKESKPLPPFTFPQNTSIFLRNEGGNRLPYTFGVSNEVRGGRYVLEIHQEHHVTYADVVVHRDLVAQTIHDIVTDPSKQRSTYERPESSKSSNTVSQASRGGESPQDTVTVVQNAQESVVVEPSAALSSTEAIKVDDTQAKVETPEQEVDSIQIADSNPEESDISEESTEPVIDINVQHVELTTGFGNVAQIDSVFTKLNTRLALGLVVGSAYTAYAGVQAMQQIDAANAETGSQSKFDTASTEADFWRTQYVGGMVFSSHIVVAYMTSRILEYRLSQSASDSNGSDLSEGVAP